MSLFTLNAARHRAETTSHVVRNTTIAAAAGAAMIGSVAPAQAFAQAPVETGASSFSSDSNGGGTLADDEALAALREKLTGN